MKTVAARARTAPPRRLGRGIGIVFGLVALAALAAALMLDPPAEATPTVQPAPGR